MESSRQLASLGRLLAGVAHEVKNPLNAMTIHLELIRQKLLRAIPSTGGAERGSQTVLGLRATEHGSESAAPRGTMTVAGTVDTDGDTHELLQHVTTIRDEVRRLDEVIQGFLKFVGQTISSMSRWTSPSLSMRCLLWLAPTPIGWGSGSRDGWNLSFTL